MCVVVDLTRPGAGREKLRSVPQAPAAPLSEEDQAADDAANAFFDQDV